MNRREPYKPFAQHSIWRARVYKFKENIQIQVRRMAIQCEVLGARQSGVVAAADGRPFEDHDLS